MFYVLDTNALYDLYGCNKLGAGLGECGKIDHDKYRQLVEKKNQIIIPTTVLTEAFIRIYDGEPINLDKWYQFRNYIKALDVYIMQNGIVSLFNEDNEMPIFKVNTSEEFEELYTGLVAQKAYDEAAFILIFILYKAIDYLVFLLGQPFNTQKDCFIAAELETFQKFQHETYVKHIYFGILNGHIKKDRKKAIKETIETSLLALCREMYKVSLAFPRLCINEKIEDGVWAEFTREAEKRVMNTSVIFDVFKKMKSQNMKPIMHVYKDKFVDILKNKNYSATEIEYYVNIQTMWGEGHHWDMNDLYDTHVLGCLDSTPKLHEFLLTRSDSTDNHESDDLCVVTFEKGMQRFLKEKHPISYELDNRLLKPKS